MDPAIWHRRACACFAQLGHATGPVADSVERIYLYVQSTRRLRLSYACRNQKSGISNHEGKRLLRIPVLPATAAFSCSVHSIESKSYAFCGLLSACGVGSKGALVKLRDRELGYQDLGSHVSCFSDTNRAGGRGLRGIASVVQAEHFQKSLQVFAIALVGLCLGVASAERSLLQGTS